MGPREVYAGIVCKIPNESIEIPLFAGGGVALLRARDALKKLKGKSDDDYEMGIDVLWNALSRPIEKIAENAGHDGAVVAKFERVGVQFEVLESIDHPRRPQHTPQSQGHLAPSLRARLRADLDRISDAS